VRWEAIWEDTWRWDIMEDHQWEDTIWRWVITEDRQWAIMKEVTVHPWEDIIWRWVIMKDTIWRWATTEVHQWATTEVHQWATMKEVTVHPWAVTMKVAMEVDIMKVAMEVDIMKVAMDIKNSMKSITRRKSSKKLSKRLLLRRSLNMVVIMVAEVVTVHQEEVTVVKVAHQVAIRFRHLTHQEPQVAHLNHGARPTIRCPGFKATHTQLMDPLAPTVICAMQLSLIREPLVIATLARTISV
jgi:hypothetical protein